MEQQYAILNADNKVIDIIKWDGVASIYLEPGTSEVLIGTHVPSQGYIYDPDSSFLFVPPRPTIGEYTYNTSDNTWVVSSVFTYEQSPEFLTDAPIYDSRVADGVSKTEALNGLFPNAPEEFSP